MEYISFKRLLRKRKYSDLDKEYVKCFKKARNHDILEGENDTIVKSVLSCLICMCLNTLKPIVRV